MAKTHPILLVRCSRRSATRRAHVRGFAIVLRGSRAKALTESRGVPGGVAEQE
jgi:hypothetical protein